MGMIPGVRRPTWIEIDLSGLEHNVSVLRSHLDAFGQRQAGIMAVVKANAYGHGARWVGHALERTGVQALGVALLDEALSLRAAGISLPILVMGWTDPRGFADALAQDITLSLWTFSEARELSRVGKRAEKQARIHLKVDTGMGRIGMSWRRQAWDIVGGIRYLPNVQVEGVFSHLAAVHEDLVFTREQVRRFRYFINELRRHGMPPSMVHLSNSAAIINHPEWSWHMVRPGILLYGSHPNPGHGLTLDVHPFLNWKTRVSQVKWMESGDSIGYGRTQVLTAPTRVATVPVGYADGYPRRLSNRGHMVIRGVACPVVGRVCMDQTMIALPDAAGEVTVGQEVLVMGYDDPSRRSVDEVAAELDTIAHEVLTAISYRVPRWYLRQGQPVEDLEELR